MKEFKEVKDSGKQKQQFTTGAQRDVAEDKPDFTYLDYSILLRDVQHYMNGAKKYARDNWKLGIPSSRCFQSLMRHVFQYLNGDRSEDHLAAIRFNAGCIIFNEENKPNVHDMPGKE